MSDSVQPEIVAFRELETLVRHVADELAGFRRRALAAEGKLRELEGQATQPARQQQRQLTERVNVLEHENAELKGRLESASTRASQMLDRVRFIRQQSQGRGER